RLCYELAAAATPVDADKPPAPALARLARLDARLPDAELAGVDARPLARAAEQRIAAAEWALGRLAGLHGDDALDRTRRALALAARAGRTEIDPAVDDWLDAARATERR